MARQPIARPLGSSLQGAVSSTADAHTGTKTRWLVYLLRCSNGSLYCGITNDLLKRLKAHAAGRASRYTRSRLPVALVYTEPQPSKSSALKREAVIKKLPRPQKLKPLAKPKKRSGGRPSC